MKALFDIETNGLLPKLDRIHTLVIRDVAPENFDERKTYRFRRNDDEDTIEEGVSMLLSADYIMGHNIIGFDVPALKKIFPYFEKPADQIIDTLVLSRIVRANQKEMDFTLTKHGKLPGKLIGSHSLDAWGYRLGLHKGDYAVEMLKKGLDPWQFWNEEMEDYCVNDVDVNEVLWEALAKDMTSAKASTLEHEIHKLATEISLNGIPFDQAAAEALKSALEKKLDSIEKSVKKTFGVWYAPVKKKIIRDPYPVFTSAREKLEGQMDRLYSQRAYYSRKYEKMYQRYEQGWEGAEDALEREEPVIKSRIARADEMLTKVRASLRSFSKVNGTPDPALGEDDSRAVWGACSVSKRTQKNKRFGDRTEGAAYCPVRRIEFNPGSRPQIIDRLTEVHGWQPEEFTDKGNPKVDDAILRKLSDTIPMAKDLAEVLFHKKILGQLSYGQGSWLNNYNKDTHRIHHYINTGGTVTGRCSHNSPNLGQVPGVRVENGEAIGGREGEYGLECRQLFHTPRLGYYTEDGKDVPWLQIGADLANIEFRMLAEATAPFDDGELIAVVAGGQDVHAYNMEKTGINNRGLIKRVLFGLLYGAGDWKLGHTFDPELGDDAKREKGRELRSIVAAGLPALAQAISQAQGDAEAGFLVGLDGRRLFCRSPHSALNLRLQSGAALVAKKWAVLTWQGMLGKGYPHGWDGDFAMLAFVHDEIQTAVRDDAADVYETIVLDAAVAAGEFFDLQCPIKADAKRGHNWAECH
jgi:DNA polymerase I-like protein with 3'-5' exonuclease and polymerase domains